jgi:hypothetical protein
MSNSYTIKALVLLGALSFLTGITIVLFHEHPGLDQVTTVVFMLLALVVIFWWYVQDTNALQYKRTTILNVCIIAIGFIALPYYFFRSRGFRKGAVATAYFLIIFIGWYVISYGGSYAAYYGLYIANGT